MSASNRSTGNHCAVFGCSNNYRKRKLLSEKICDVHHQTRSRCGCGLFKLHRFPVDEEQRRLWLVSLNRKNFLPSHSSRVCSEHFLSGERSATNPTPTLNLGYERKLGTDEAEPAQTEPCIHTLETYGLTYRPCTDEAEHVESEQRQPTAEFCGSINPILGHLLFGNATIGHRPRPSHCSDTNHDDFAAEPKHEAALGADCKSGQARGASPEPACEPSHVTNKSVQVQLLTRHEASQANRRKILSTSATQTEPHAVSSGSLSFLSLEQSSSLASVRGRLHSCQQCTYVTLDKSTMNRHLQKHMGEPPLQCHFCPAAFTRKSELVRHVRTHTGERPFCCAHCNASFVQKNSLVIHIRTHTGERPFSCVHCDASFVRKNSLVRHIRMHTGERPFSCVHCNASFVQKGSLLRHIRTHTGERPFSCNHCNSSFSMRSGFIEHMRIHTGERPFSCVRCNASFGKKSSLVRHIRAHSGERSFPCVHCVESFCTKSTLILHMRTHAHTLERPFSCVH
ncbi:zinc finger protein 37 homolog isoform X1 [Rhipicephalus sanguineus]|uniref:zinc finger protein 37 homolog isoform X1 n=1 Tax=Rhipicephalus sanguineus TaxID=34632 RepID=UPI0020C46C55|nr:zinc finger protein 37 homolog isoform X1 [Rhipicephalus sanguineus]